MDGSRFDLLARALGRSVDRRAGVRGVLAAAAASLGLAAAADAAPKGEQCLRTGARCGKGSGNNGGPCRKCCTRHWTKGKKKKRCTCKPDGVRCNNSAQCCNGACTDRVCGGLEPLCIPAGDACPEGGPECCDGLDCVGDGVAAACCPSGNVCGTGAGALCCADGEECGGNASDGFFCCPGTACGLACCTGATPVCASPGTCTGVAGACPGGSCTGGPGTQGTCDSAACNCNGDPGVCVSCTAPGSSCANDNECCGIAVCCASAGSTCQVLCV